MAYVEILFARRMFVWFAAIVVMIAIFVVGSTLSFPGNIKVQHAHAVGFGAIFGIAGYIACIMATMLAATLNRDRSHLAYMWTRPIPRERIALGYMVVDVVAIVLAFFLIAGLTAMILTNVPNVHLVSDPKTGASLARFLAMPLMWYAVVEAATSWNGLRAQTVGGLSWAVFWCLLILATISLPTPLTQIIALVNVLNPLAYAVSASAGSSINILNPVTLDRLNPQHAFLLGYGARTVLAYVIFVTGCIVATYAWKRMEA